MRQLFLRFYLTVVVCFLASSLVIGALYKNLLERSNEHYLSDIFKTTISVVESTLGDLPPSIWHDEVKRLKNKLPLPVEIETLNTYTLSPGNQDALINGDIIFLQNQDVYLHRIPDTGLMVVLGPVPYLQRLDNFAWADLVALLLMCAALGVPTWLWLRPLWRDLQHMARQSRQLGEGDFSTRVTLHEGSTLNSLGVTFNRMAHDVEELTASRKALIDAVSHDLRTPLARLRYRLEAIKGGAESSQQIVAIERDLGQIDELIEEWLTMSTLDKPQLKLETQAIEILPWLRRQISEFSSQGNITPELINLLPGKTPFLEADSHYLTRALANLMGNARRYGGTAILLTIEWENGLAKLHVDDNGQGIPESERQRLLQPFERLEVSRNRQTGGFGLGLAIVSMIMRGHNGAAVISDAPLGGARVTLCWPSPLKNVL
ncbi:ATP-binding protein [Iodobacter fluviatilis]|uniref:histidine kinase n=1 Tax=Iodobacter fluviatilis TaxID=537 RepID=A0A377SWR0_9NEIS|nr:ATP-binding protein [Iodobacter fluviatilis]TCU87906.1 two-component system sensor histidine kinase RstB [Iodobacter fluviatilis]STR45407.1 Sensor protein RstB [Iodobacter fluviatilis]